MLIRVDPSSGVPVYRQLMDQIRFHIASGLLRPGDPLPSIRSLSGELNVNPMTISKAYAFLASEQVILRRPGKPLVVKDMPENELQRAKRERLRHALRSPATIARQLGIPDEEAIRLFEELLGRSGQPKEPSGD